jgi:hypothetical protein
MPENENDAALLHWRAARCFKLAKEIMKAREQK